VLTAAQLLGHVKPALPEGQRLYKLHSYLKYKKSHTIRIFTDTEELLLMLQIPENYTDKGLYESDEDFKLDALRFHQQLMIAKDDEAHSGDIPHFTDSRPFLYSAHLSKVFACVILWCSAV
jgi:hypothetical protein